MTIDCIIVNLNGADWLRKSIPSIKGQVRQVIVVDGGSEDDSADYAESHGARVVRLHGNPGFAAGNNVGIAASDADAFLLLNNDTFTDNPDAVSTLALHFSPRVACVGTVGAYLSLDFACIGETKTEGQYIDYVPFWCVLIPRTVWEKVGWLDEKFGIGYSEDVDWCLRAADLGYEFAYKDVGIQHLGAGGQTAQSLGYTKERLTAHCYANIDYLKKKHKLPRVLVVRYDAHGDILMTACAVKKLRDKHPTGVIHWLTKTVCHGAVEITDTADHIWDVEDPRTTRFLEDAVFDFVYNFNDYPADVAVRVRQVGGRIHGSYVLQDEVGEVAVNRCWRIAKDFMHQSEFHALTAGVTLDSKIPPIAKRFLTAPPFKLHKEDAKYVAVHAGAGSGDAKVIPVPLVHDICANLVMEGFRPLILGNTDYDKAIANNCDDLPIVDCVGVTRFQDLPSILYQCTGAIMTDSALRHVAVGVGIPTVGLFTLANPKSCGDYGKGHTDAKSDVWCSPCWQFVCPLKGSQHLQCWKGIDAKTIVDAFLALVPNEHAYKVVRNYLTSDTHKARNNLARFCTGVGVEVSDMDDIPIVPWAYRVGVNAGNHWANPLELPFKTETLDWVFCPCIVGSIENIERVMAEWYRVLKPGGRMAICIAHPHRHPEGKADPKDVEKWMRMMKMDIILSKVQEEHWNYELVAIRPEIKRCDSFDVSPDTLTLVPSEASPDHMGLQG